MRSILFSFLFLLLLPFISFAEGFVPCGGAGEDTCQACHFAIMLNTLVKWLIGMLSVLMAVIFVVAGIKLVTSGGNTSARESAKSMITNGIVGFVVVLSAWLLVDTILKMLTNSEFGTWNKIECVAQPVPTIIREVDMSPEKQAEFASDNGADSPANPADGTLTHNAALEKLASDKFSVVSTGNCSDKTKKNCTSLDGMKQTTVDRMVELQAKVGEKFVITGGTETGHATNDISHGNGYKVDLRPTPALTNYIYDNFTKVSANKYKDDNGNTYYRHEPDHWDVTITN